MNINRHNYEEYFLLYVDNELKQDERTEVENFVQQNPDLKDELEMLQHTILSDEELAFDAKDLLYKKEEGINVTNYEEYFVLSVDDELDKKEADEVEKFVLKHPELQEEFTLLQKTKLEPEVIEFKNKEALYKQESKVRRIVPIAWMRISAAAAIIGIIATTWIFSHSTQSGLDNGTIASISKAVKPAGNNNQKISSGTVTNQAIASLQNGKKVQANNYQATEGVKESVASIANTVTKRSARKEIQEVKREAIQPAQQNTAFEVQQSQMASNLNNLPVPERRINTTHSDNEEAGTKIINPIINENALVHQASKENLDNEKPTVQHAVYREVDTNDDDRNIYIGVASVNKNKVKALFKKAAGIFGKNIDKED